MRPARRLFAYFEDGDPYVAARNSVALIILGNQPFYPLYVWYCIGRPGALLSLATWASSCLFAAVPAAGRRHAAAGALLLSFAGIANTAVCEALFGLPSKVDLFYLPCAMIGLALVPWRQRGLASVLALAPLALLVGLRASAALPAPLLSATQAQGLATMHEVSVASLLVAMSYLALKARRREAGGRSDGSV